MKHPENRQALAVRGIMPNGSAIMSLNFVPSWMIVQVTVDFL